MDLQKLRDALSYDPDSGLFTRKSGKIAGYKSRGGYIQLSVFNKKYYASRLAYFYMTGEWPEYIDHINRVVDDNRWANLRAVSHQENCRNRGIRDDNKSGVPGCWWDKERKKWILRVNGTYLGYFKTIKEAKIARKEFING